MKLRRYQTSGLFAPLVASAMLLAACGGDDGDNGTTPGDPDGASLVLEGETIADAELWQAAQEEGRLTLYTSHLEEGEIRAAEVFTEDTGIEVEVVRLPGGEMHERVLSEHGGGVLEADVINASDVNFNIEYLAEEIIEPHRIPDELWDAIDDPWKQEDGAWYSTYVSTMGISYNNELVSEDEAPSSWADLLDPKWKGQIASLSADIGGTGWAVALFQHDVLGDDYWAALAAQEPAFLGASNIREEVVRGEYSIAINGSATMGEAIKSDAPVTILWAEEGTPTNTYNLSMFTDAPHPNAAKLYMNWRNSLRGLTVGVENSNTYVVRPDAPPPILRGEERHPSFEDIKPYSNLDDYVDLQDTMVPEWNDIFRPGI